jgi:hypothetical protein
MNNNFVFRGPIITGLLTHNIECMHRAGVSGHFIIHRYCPCQRALYLAIALELA